MILRGLCVLLEIRNMDLYRKYYASIPRIFSRWTIGMIDNFDWINTCSCCGEPFGSRSNHIANHSNRKLRGLNAAFSFAGGANTVKEETRPLRISRRRGKGKGKAGASRHRRRSHPTKRRGKK